MRQLVKQKTSAKKLLGRIRLGGNEGGKFLFFTHSIKL